MKFELMYAFLEFAIIDTPVVKLQARRIVVVTSAETSISQGAYRNFCRCLLFRD
jgi:hypothetical protein